MKKRTKAQKLESDIRFVKNVASDYDLNINDTQAKKAIKECGNDYYKLKEYFQK